MVVLKYFSADWCGPCKQQEPVVQTLEDNIDGLTVERHDVDEDQDIANKFSVRSVPTLVVIVDGNIITQFTGFTQETELRNAIENAKQNANETAPL